MVITMPSIKEFSIERFEMSLKTLITFCEGGKSNKYYDIVFNPSNSDNVKHCIYKGAFMESVEYLYGFIPELFKEYCKQFGVEIISRGGRVETIGYLDLIKSMKSVDKINLEQISFLSNVYKTRGEIIHQTLMDKDSYYKKLSWIAIQVEKYDLNELYKYVYKLYKEINNSYDKGIKGNLIVKAREISDLTYGVVKSPSGPIIRPSMSKSGTWN